MDEGFLCFAINEVTVEKTVRELVSRYDAIGNPLNDGVYSYTWKMGRQLAGMSGNGRI